MMEHGDVSPNLETENCSVEDPAQDEGGVDANIAGPSESKESLLIQLETNQSIETTKLKINNDVAQTSELENSSVVEPMIQDNESEKNHYVCKFCSKVFDKHQALGGHMNGHSRDERNLEKFGKLSTWIQATYPTPLITTLASEVGLQGTPTNEGACNSYNHLVEVGNVHSQQGGQWTTQQSAQQILLSQNYQAQEPQSYQSLQGLQNNQALKRPQSAQVVQRPQNYQAPQGLQNYQSLQGLQNYQASQGSQSYQGTQQFQNYQTLQRPQYYQASQGFQSYLAPQRPQYYQAPQGFQNNQIPQGFQNNQIPQGLQSYQTPQGSQSYQIPQGSQSYQAPQGPQSYQALQGSQNYKASQRSQSNQAPQGSRQQLVADANNQQKIHSNSKMSNMPTSLAKVPTNEKMNISSNSQGSYFQEEVQGPQRYKPNPRNLRNGDRLTTGPFINEQLNNEYYAQLRSNVLGRNNQMISTPNNYRDEAQYRPVNSPNTTDSFNQSNID